MLAITRGPKLPRWGCQAWGEAVARPSLMKVRALIFKNSLLACLSYTCTSQSWGWLAGCWTTDLGIKAAAADKCPACCILDVLCLPWGLQASNGVRSLKAAEQAAST